MTNVETYRPKSAIALAAVAYLLIALYLVQVFFYSQQNLLSGAALAATAAAITWLLFVRPKLVFSDEAIVVVNPLISYTVPWRDVEQIDTRFALTIVTNSRRIQAWAAPAPGKGHGRNIRSAELQGLNIDTGLGLRPGDSPRSHSGVAAQIAKARIANLGSIDDSAVAARTRFSYPAATSIVACLCIFLVANLLHY